jgi:peptidyl-prolyl cis-trans isomerase D
MAILQDIRNRAGIFIMVFVGVALFLFIVDPEVFSFIFNKQHTNIAKINDESIDYEEYIDKFSMHEQFLKIVNRTNSLDSETIEAIREQAWNDLLMEYILAPQYEEVGIDVKESELEDLLYGANIHSIIHQNFTNQQTGVLDTASVRDFFSQAQEEYESQVIADYFIDMITLDRKQTKYNNMIAKGFYTPVALAKKDYYERNTNSEFEYVIRKFKDVNDNQVKISEADIKAYYNSNLYKFQIEENSREIEYVVFDVFPSSEDSLKALEIMNDYYEEFIEDEDPLSFSRRYSDSFDGEMFYKVDELPAGLGEEFFNEGLGAVSDISLVNGSYFAAIIAEETERPDSANASHILIRVDEEKTLEQAQIIADSLFAEIEKGEDFMMLAFTYSEDPGSQQMGGELGWFADGTMVPEFNEACFTGQPGDVVMVETTFGIHIIKINDHTEPITKVKLAILQKELNYSEATYNSVFGTASSFMANSPTGKDFDENAAKQGYVKRIASELLELDRQIPGLEDPRNLIRWTFDETTKKGDVSEVYPLGDKFVVAKLSAVREKGDAPLEDVKEQIEQIVLQNKKAEMLESELQKDLASGMTIKQIAAKYNEDSDIVSSINFNAFSIPGLGIEPNVLAVATSLPVDKTSKPIQGNNGVYVVKVLSRTEAPEKSDFSSEQLTIMRNHASSVGFRVFEALQNKAEIEDYRTMWF